VTVIHGFELVEERHIPEINTRARRFRHLRTGAELLSLENDDENKVFGVTFKTPPADSTGVPHIMEHSVLGGSRKYPVKEPFVELLKGSLNTFLNAMTYPDMTCYPVASTNLKDFYNLIDVYLDAVFFPRISEKTLQQEGWHYELEAPDGPLTYRGIVFNEMKGAYSSPDNLLGRYTEQHILPDGPYGFDSGGDPMVMPDLTYEQFKAFHDTYYHPSNARIWFYGDDDPEERLRLIDAFIAGFERIEVDNAIPLQPRFPAPRRATVGYDAGEETGERRGMVTVSWLLTETIDVEQGLALDVLSHILVDTPASPLRKALIDSGLGEDLADSGVSPYQREMYFSTGLKGIDPADVDKVETLIMDTLAALARDGIDPEMVEAAMNTVEFQLRERNTGRFPRGLALMIGVLPVWLHGGDPLDALAFEAPLERIKAGVAAGRYFEELIARYLLDNPHRSTVALVPDPSARAEREAAEQARLAAARAAMSEADLQTVIADAEELRRIQETPDPPEALATIPTLTLADLDRNIRRIPVEHLALGEGQLLYHDLFTNGIVYLDLGFDLHTLPQDLLPYVPLFGRALLEMGTETEDFVKLSQRIGRKTGGIAPTTLIAPVRGGGDTATAWLFLHGKAMVAQAPDLLDILRDVLLTARLDNPTRFRQMALEEKTGAESGLVPGGHMAVLSRLRARFAEAHWAGEQTGGISQLFFLRQLIQEIDTDWPGVLAKLEAIRRILINRGRLIANVTLDAANWARFQPQLEGLINALPAAPATPVAWSRPAAPSYEGLTIPAQVNYVAKGANLYDLGYRLHGSYIPIVNYLNMTWLWERIRAQGGAYGGFCGFDQVSGVFAFTSYRDPNLLGTLANYDGAADYLRQLDLSQEELTRAIIGAIGQIDDYLLPDAKGFRSLQYYLTGYSDEERQKIRDEVLSTTAADFRAFGEALAGVNENGAIVVMGSAEAINKANAERGQFLQVTKVL